MKDTLRDKLITIMFLVIIIGFMLVNIIKKDTDISYSERRRLEKLPTLTFNSLTSGTFNNKFDSYVTDQFINRDDFRKMKIFLEMNTKNNYNDLYIYNGYIIKENSKVNKSSIDSLSNKINLIKEKYPNNRYFYMIVPDKNYFVDSDNLKLDYNELISIMNDNLKDLEYIDIMGILSLEDYYKTDTHWRQENLVKVVNKMSKEMNFNLDSSFSKEYLSEFNGVYSSQILSDEVDKLYILTNDSIMNSKVFNYETNNYTSVYDMSKLNGLDKYDVYLSGSSALLKITNMNIDSNKRDLVVFRDSYGSSLIPLLIDGFNEITVVDTRYISPKLLDNYIDFNNKDILFMYSTLLINDSGTIK